MILDKDTRLITSLSNPFMDPFQDLFQTTDHDSPVIKNPFDDILDNVFEFSSLSERKDTKPMNPFIDDFFVLDHSSIPLSTQTHEGILCPRCGNRSLRDQFIDRICLRCHNEQQRVEDFRDDLGSELMKALNRISELETKVDMLETHNRQLRLGSSLSTALPSSTSDQPSKLFPPPPSPPSSSPLLPSLQNFAPNNSSQVGKKISELSKEEIDSLSQEYLNQLSVENRRQLQNRVKEIKLLESMSAKEREEYYLMKKQQNQEQESFEGILSDLNAQLEDKNSLFAKMRRITDETEIVGRGKFSTSKFFD